MKITTDGRDAIVDRFTYEFLFLIPSHYIQQIVYKLYSGIQKSAQLRSSVTKN
jgi:hypothetical protein